MFIHMFKLFLFVSYSIRILSYLGKITLSDPTHMMKMIDPITICVHTKDPYQSLNSIIPNYQ